MSRPVILALDDDGAVLRAVARDLRRAYGKDYRILAAQTPASALEQLARMSEKGEQLALFVVDQRMPGMTGAELCFKAREIAPQTARVIFSAYHDRAARMCPCSAVVEKPDLDGKLRDVIESSANGSREATDEQMRQREREAEEELARARDDFRETTEKLRSWQPPNACYDAKRDA